MSATKQDVYSIAEAMQAKIIERNAEFLQAQAGMNEMIELARALSGAPPEAIIGDVRIGFVMPPTNGEVK